jgi:hypothetical protein
MLRKLAIGSLLLSSLGLGGLGCTSAYADRPAEPSSQVAVAVPAPEAVPSPYTIEIMGEDGKALNAYSAQGKFYVLGNSGERYTIRVANPTARRVEAVVSVDGLDAIDGEAADLGKRGYIVPAYGELRIEGFRTSTSHVATFRFSSVSNSYAGKKGVARNVGVIGVAIFDEQPPPEVIVRDQIIVGSVDEGKNKDYRYDFEDDLAPPPPPVYGGDYGGAESGTADADAPSGGYAGGGEGRATAKAGAPARRPSIRPSDGEGAPMPTEEPSYDYQPEPTAPTTTTQPARPPCSDCQVKKESRPGLGTEFGESRYSAVSFTKFVRSSATPVALAELRYNDAAGLMALGIPVQPSPDANELATRETADPFPGERFAQPPR